MVQKNYGHGAICGTRVVQSTTCTAPHGNPTHLLARPRLPLSHAPTASILPKCTQRTPYTAMRNTHLTPHARLTMQCTNHCTDHNWRCNINAPHHTAPHCTTPHHTAPLHVAPRALRTMDCSQLHMQAQAHTAQQVITFLHIRNELCRACSEMEQPGMMIHNGGHLG